VVLPDHPFRAGNEVVVPVSGLGATPVMKLDDELKKLVDMSCYSMGLKQK
jgi:dihydroxyacetone kinase